MRPLAYVRPRTVEEALRHAQSKANSAYLGGGTNLVDLIREGIEGPDLLIDVSRLPLGVIAETENGGVRIGAAVRNSDMAAHPLIATRYPAISRAILAGASGQIRNMATLGGNLLQRTRCLYFYDQEAACNKRQPGSGCDALEGFHRMGAVLGERSHCIAVHPSDLCVALAAFDAEVEIRSLDDERTVPISEFLLQPGDTPHIENTLGPGEMIAGVELPALPVAATSRYRKVRDRASYAFALVSLASALKASDGIVVDARLALGGVAGVPWRCREAESQLIGSEPSDEAFSAAGEAAAAGARGDPQTDFKVGLIHSLIESELRALRDPAR